ncbi:hypothetical protein GQ457_07G001170 [Hibiscus cannabinus]
MLETPLLPQSVLTSHFVGPGGRPPDCTPAVVLPQSHERNNFPALVEDSCVSKKAKDDVTRVKKSVSNSLDVTMDDSPPTSELGNQPQQEQTITDGARLGNVSYATMAYRIPNDKGKMGASSSFSMDDVVILEDDYLIGDIQLIDLENNYFLVRFEKESDYSMVLTEGPWTIYGFYLTVQPWHRDFNTNEKHPTHVVAIFRLIATVIGRVVKIDYNTMRGARGKFARLAVMVDLNKPMLSCINIDGRIQKLEYESLHQICYKCGMYGHAKETCNDTVGGGSSNVNPMPLAGKETPTPSEPNENDLYGPWMIVDTRHRQSPSTYNNVKSGTARPHYRGDSGTI